MLLFTTLVLLAATALPAHAYIDPGSGSYMLQMGLAGLLAVVFSMKLYWQRLRTLASRVLSSHRRPAARL